MTSFVQQLALKDPTSRLIAQLERLDAMRDRALGRKRAWGQEIYADPDTNAAVKCEELAARLVAEHTSVVCAGVDTITTLDRDEAIAQLRDVLRIWEDRESVSDEQWRASRAPAPVVAIAPRNGVKRRKASAP